MHLESHVGKSWLRAATFADLSGWEDDNQAEALDAFVVSCNAMEQENPNGYLSGLPIMGEAYNWHEICRIARTTKSSGARRFFETWFRPWHIEPSGDVPGLTTGYFEPVLSGSRNRSQHYPYPIYRMPDMQPPLPERADIDAGALENMGLELMWVSSAVDAFFLHIQGSGLVRLDDGSDVRIGVAGKNGHPYFAIGRELVARNEIAAEEISMQSIRAWLNANPADAFDVMAKNRSYIFFRETGESGPVGAQGVTLTPGRSLAIDNSYLAYGVPIWLETTIPDGSDWKRLMIAQDTGSAIRGRDRGDIFFGSDHRAGELAGMMKASGQYWVFLPSGIPVNLVAQLGY